MSVAALEDDYQNNNELDNDAEHLVVRAERNISANTQIGISVNHIRRDFLTTGQSDDDTGAELWFRRGFAGALAIEFSVGRYTRSGRSTGHFDENVATIFFEYSPTRGAN